MKKQLVFGHHVVQSLLEQTPDQVITLYRLAEKNSQPLKHILALAQKNQIPIQIISKKKLAQWLPDVPHQGIVAACQVRAPLGETALGEALKQTAKTKPFWLVLEQIQDPRNLGACLRTAEGAGVTGVVLVEKNMATITPVVRKAACGAVESLPLYHVKNMARTLDRFKAAGIWVVGLAGEAKQDFYAIDLDVPIALVFGSEGIGLRSLTQAKCDYVAALPMQGCVKSLNVSVAVGVCLYQVLNVRNKNR